MDTLQEARRLVADKKDDGIECPCCRQFAKRYRRRLNKGMVLALAWIYQMGSPEREWVFLPDAPRHVMRNREHGRLAAWGFIEAKPNADPTKKDSGYWRITENGSQFIEGRRLALSHCYFFGGEAPELDHAEYLHVSDVVRGFDYRELMAPRAQGEGGAR